MTTDVELAMWARTRKLVGEQRWAELVRAAENRMTDHLLQKLEVAPISKDVVGGREFFGVPLEPRVPDEPRSMRSRMSIGEFVDHAGVAQVFYVTLRCWDDVDCKTAIEVNKSMVARILADRKMTFSTRTQTEVQTRTIIMWLRLRGLFFWDRDNKTNAANLYFDRTSNVLRTVHSDDFQNWLMAHCQVSPDRADFKTLMCKIDATSMNHETAHECVPGALFDRRGNVIYISNGDSEMVRVKPAVDGVPCVELVPNGTDNVVFKQGMTLKPWKIVEGDGVDPFEACPPFSTANYQSEHGRMIARLWFLGLASCLRSYPAIVFTGKMRSGKSRTAKGVFELLGAPNRLTAIRANGEGDFWTALNKGGVVCFDNVDTKNVWFGDAMQLACTDGSTEVRTLFTNEGTTTLRANAKIVMTSNNPLFASESGLDDRLQIVRLEQFDGANGKESGDSSITAAIEERRDSAMTWFSRTVSRALADSRKVETNVNLRHPDFAEFAMRCARSISEDCYRDAILALKSAEFDKAMLAIQNNPTMNYVYEALSNWFRADETKNVEWSGTASDLLSEIVKIYPDLERSKYISATIIGRALPRHLDQLGYIFEIRPPWKSGPKTFYGFKGFTDNYSKNMQNKARNDEVKGSTEDADIADLF